MPDTLYYDGQCPLCVKEMDKLRVIKDEQLQLVDIHGLSEPNSPVDKDKTTRAPLGARWAHGHRN